MNKPAMYIQSCPFCENGLLRFARCSQCDAIAALCDECDLMWADLSAVGEKASRPSDSTHPRCPHCDRDAQWTFPSPSEIESAGLGRYSGGRSE